MRIRWTPQAADDLAGIRAQIAHDSPAYAQGLVDRLYRSVEILAHYPESGRIVPEHGNQKLRELIRNPYRIIYHCHHDAVTILTIVHSSRMLPSTLGDFDEHEGE